MISREDMVGSFNEAAENKTFYEGGSVLAHATCFGEEVGELGAAIAAYLDEQNEETRANLAKEWADAQVTLSNLAWFFSLNGDEAFFRVAQNNMTKLVDGKIVRREDGKVMKPEGYQKPDMVGL